MTKIQGFGFILTFIGLYLYDRTSDAAKADKRAKAMQSKAQGTILPLATDHKGLGIGFTASPVGMSAGTGAYPKSSVGTVGQRDEKRDDDRGQWRQEGGHTGAYLPPGTKAEETWRPHEMNSRTGIGVS